jgi:hypothetical protein
MSSWFRMNVRLLLMILAGRMLLVKSETKNLKSLLDSFHTDVAKKCITPKEKGQSLIYKTLHRKLLSPPQRYIF